MFIRPATLNDLEVIICIDEEVIGNKSREVEIRESINNKNCLVGCIDDEIYGFLVYHEHFFGNLFIELVIVSPRNRRSGIAKELMKYVEENCQSNKLFSSTNQSNEPMHEVFKSLGYVESGYIDNLDEEDPEIIYVRLKH